MQTFTTNPSNEIGDEKVRSDLAYTACSFEEDYLSSEDKVCKK
jgi:hypothetical protein